MSTQERYQLPIDGLEWKVPGNFDAASSGSTRTAASPLRRLYEKGKHQQWNASNRIDWSLESRPRKSRGAAGRVRCRFSARRVWNRMTDKEKADLRRHSIRPMTFRSFCTASRAR